MIAVIIFFIHIIFAVIVFSKTYQSDSLMQAILNIAFIIILFSVGWVVSDLVVGLIISSNGYVIEIPVNKFLQFLLKTSGFFIPNNNGTGVLQPKDTISLIILTVIEIFFYRFFFKNFDNTAKS
ncbi:MAG TPA: hypothetical protein PLG90_04945 [Ignavibacteria bacterium]|nr:hypothetical protein [Ignavibacteria bacterium]